MIDGDGEGQEPDVNPTIPAEQNIDTPELDAQEPDEGQPEDEIEEFDWNGTQIQGPRGLKDAILRQEDYTKKTQAVAEERKLLESREHEINQRAEVTEAELDARAHIRGVEAELERLDAFDWNAFQQARQVDPLGAQEVWDYIAHLKSQKAELDGTLGQAATDRTQKAQQDFARRVEQTLAEAPKFIPNFKPAVIGEIASWLQNDVGISQEAITSNWSPQFLKLAHLAKIGDSLSKRAANPKPAAEPAPSLTTVRPRSAPITGLSDKLSTDEWMKRRDAQVKTKGRR